MAAGSSDFKTVKEGDGKISHLRVGYRAHVLLGCQQGARKRGGAPSHSRWGCVRRRKGLPQGGRALSAGPGAESRRFQEHLGQQLRLCGSEGAASREAGTRASWCSFITGSRLQCNDRILVHFNLRLPGSISSLSLQSSWGWQTRRGFTILTRPVFELVPSSHLPTSASRSAGITGLSHCARPKGSIFVSEYNQPDQDGETLSLQKLARCGGGHLYPQLLRRLRQENCLNLESRGCSEPRSCHCTTLA
ncbi:hypothetical protein AAY473_016413 [Plecturocebus cupreus]